jgi:nonsense-mediated mRNA decay protein 3
MVGRKDGHDLHRVTFLVRIPEFRIGDFILLDDQVYRVLKILKRHALSLEINSGKKVKLTHSNINEGTILGGDELIFDAVVVTENIKEVQILDPKNYLTIDLIKPENFSVESDSVKIFKYSDLMYLIPNLIN